MSQFALLGTLTRGAARRSRRWRSALLLDRTALSRTLDPLVERSLVEIAPGEDARTREVAITADGRALVAKAQPCWAAAQARVAERLGPDRVEALVALLARTRNAAPRTRGFGQERTHDLARRRLADSRTSSSSAPGWS